MQPPILIAPVSGKPFLIYVRVMDHSLGALLAQNNDQGYEQAIYYLSRTMIGVEHRYNPIEKECLALVFAVQKMWHYLVVQIINVIPKVNPLRLLMTKPSSLNGRLVKWAILLYQYEMHFLPQKAVKEKRWQIFRLNIQIQERLNFMRISQTRLLKFVWPRCLSKDRCGSSSSIVHPEWVREEKS